MSCIVIKESILPVSQKSIIYIYLCLSASLIQHLKVYIFVFFAGPFPNVDSLPPPPGPVYYPFVPDPYSQPPLPGFDSCVPLMPTYHYVGPWHPVSPPYSNSPRMHNTVNPGHIHQVSYLAAPTPSAHFVPQTIWEEDWIYRWYVCSLYCTYRFLFYLQNTMKERSIWSFSLTGQTFKIRNDQSKNLIL